jgi:DNA-binding protein H-NS
VFEVGRTKIVPQPGVELSSSEKFRLQISPQPSPPSSFDASKHSSTWTGLGHSPSRWEWMIAAGLISRVCHRSLLRCVSEKGQ